MSLLKNMNKNRVHAPEVIILYNHCPTHVTLTTSSDNFTPIEEQVRGDNMHMNKK